MRRIHKTKEQVDLEDAKTLWAQKIELIRRIVKGPSLYKACRVIAEEVMGLTIAPHHELMLRHVTSGRRRSVCMYRGCGKSWTVTVPRALAELVRWSEHRLLIASRTDIMAEGFATMAKTVIEDNEVFREAFGNLVGTKQWARSEWTIASRKGNLLEPSVRIVGVGGSVVSRHYTGHLLDDLIDNNNSATEGQRARMKLWYDIALQPTLEPEGFEQNAGTRYHPFDLHQRIEEEQGEGSALRLPAVSEQVWGPEKVPWPERHSLEWFLRKRDGPRGEDGKRSGGMLPQAWAGQFQQNVEMMVGKIVKEDWLVYFNAGDAAVPVVKFILGDFAASRKDMEHHSYFVLLEVWVSADGHLWVVDGFRKRGIDFDGQVDTIRQWNAEKKPDWIGLEANQFQDWMGQHLAKKHKLFNIIGCVPGSDKTLRMNTHLAPMALARRVHIRRDLYWLVEEVVMFPDGENDDGVDCLNYAVELAKRFAQEDFNDTAQQLLFADRNVEDMLEELSAVEREKRAIKEKLGMK